MISAGSEHHPKPSGTPILYSVCFFIFPYLTLMDGKSQEVFPFDSQGNTPNTILHKKVYLKEQLALDRNRKTTFGILIP
jgi:hypothetical protein